MYFQIFCKLVLFVRAQLQAEKTRREEAERQAKDLQDRLKAYEEEMDEYRDGNIYNLFIPNVMTFCDINYLNTGPRRHSK